MKSRVKLKRVYDAPEPSDGYRVLVDRVWPRGISKEKAAVSEWAKDLAPSTELRKWFGHDPKRWDGFRKRYIEELKGSAPALEELRRRSARETVTLVYSAKDEAHNQAVVLKELLTR